MIEPKRPPHPAGRRRTSHTGHIILLIGWLVFALCARIVPAQSAAKSSENDTGHLVEQGVALYEQKDLDGAQKALERAETLFPDNYAVPYYLGLIHLSKERRAAAISQWQRYLRLDPDSENATHLRKLLTLLLCQEATAKAKKALAEEAKLKGGKTEANALAITPFQNMGSASLKPLGKGMAAMLISDLSKVPDLQVVDRIELQALLQEMRLGASGLVEVQTAPELGRLLKVKRVSTGSFADIEKRELEIAGITMDADVKDAVGSQHAQGKLDDFFTLEKEIACGILTAMGKECDAAPKAFHKMHTRSLPAFVAFSEGLDYFDQRQYDDARKKFQQALKEDPEFDLAQQALAATPLGTMAFWNTSQMVSSASASGIPSTAAASATAGSATVGTTAAGSAAAGTAAAGGAGLSATTLTIVGGVVAVGGTLALAGGGGGGDTIEDGANVPNLSGDWSGGWNDTASDAYGSMSLRLTQNENSLSGAASFAGADCISSATISGTVSGQSVTMDLSYDSGGSARFEGTFSTPTLNGTLSFTSGNCEGQFDASCEQLSSADVTW